MLADRFEGKRLNSPNDLVYRSDGTLYFTDPPFGLPKFGDDPRKELSFSGVYSVRDGHISLLVKDLNGPNGIAFSPDESFLYVGNWDPKRKVVMRYEVRADGSLGAASVFADFTETPGEDAIDGIKVDTRETCTFRVPGVCGFCHLTESASGRSWDRSTRTTLRGATTTGSRSICARERASIAFG